MSAWPVGAPGPGCDLGQPYVVGELLSQVDPPDATDITYLGRYSPDGSRIVRAEREGELADAESIGRALADDLRAQGAEEILAEVG